MKVKVKNLAELDAFAKKVGSDVSARNVRADQAVVLALLGDLGAGKTAFTKALAKNLGSKASVQSPTFVIEKVYALEHPRFKHLVHIDAYRLEDEKDLQKLRFAELLADPSNLIAVEWADRVEKILPPKTFRIEFFSDEGAEEALGERLISYHAAK